MISETKEKGKCFSCGKEASIRLTIEPDGGSLYVCDNLDCKEDALLQLDEADFEYQGRSYRQIRYAETVGAISIIVMIAVTVGVLVHKLLSQ
jgi:hypothetical protein